MPETAQQALNQKEEEIDRNNRFAKIFIQEANTILEKKITEENVITLLAKLQLATNYCVKNIPLTQELTQTKKSDNQFILAHNEYFTQLQELLSVKAYEPLCIFAGSNPKYNSLPQQLTQYLNQILYAYDFGSEAGAKEAQPNIYDQLNTVRENFHTKKIHSHNSHQQQLTQYQIFLIII